MSVRERLAAYRDRARRKLLAAFREEHTPHEVAASFAIGIFVTSMPTGGLGISLFFVFVTWWAWISKPALFASIAVLNPFVKPAVYIGSYQLGGVLLGTQPVRSLRSLEASAIESAGLAIRQLVVGNLVIGVVLSVCSYWLVLWLTRAYRRREQRLSDASLGEVVATLRRR